MCWRSRTSCANWASTPNSTSISRAPRRAGRNGAKSSFGPKTRNSCCLICTQTYRDRVENKVPADEGRGVYWEGGIVYNYIYKAKANERFMPVLFGDESDESVPVPLQGFAKFRIRAFDLSDPGFEALYRELTGQPAVIKPVLGAKVALGTKTPTATAGRRAAARRSRR